MRDSSASIGQQENRRLEFYDADIADEIQGQEKDYLLIIGAGGFGRVVLEYAENAYTCAFMQSSSFVHV